MRKNKTIRETARNAGVYLWEIGEYLGVSENTVIRWLRKPMDRSKEEMVTAAISAIAERKAKGDF